jgi:hypothetical protein
MRKIVLKAHLFGKVRNLAYLVFCLPFALAQFTGVGNAPAWKKTNSLLNKIKRKKKTDL